MRDIIGGIINLIRYAINKLHKYLMLIKAEKYEISGKFMTKDTLDEFLLLIEETRGYGSQLVHLNEVKYLRDALKEKRVREK